MPIRRLEYDLGSSPICVEMLIQRDRRLAFTLTYLLQLMGNHATEVVLYDLQLA